MRQVTLFDLVAATVVAAPLVDAVVVASVLVDAAVDAFVFSFLQGNTS